jgi:hypothetical protein
MKSQSPFLDGFRQAVHPDFVPPALTRASLPEPAQMDKPRTNEEFAEHYRTSVRSIARMKAQGIDLGDAVAVTVHLVNQQKVSVPTLERATEILEHLS